jgi:hypothetical protein
VDLSAIVIYLPGCRIGDTAEIDSENHATGGIEYLENLPGTKIPRQMGANRTSLQFWLTTFAREVTR